MEKSKDFFKKQYAEITAYGDSIKATMLNIANQTHTSLEGLKYMIKSFDSAYEKVVVRKAFSDFSEMYDIIRFTFIIDEGCYGTMTNKILEMLELENYHIHCINNYWRVSNNPYNGVNVQLEAASGVKIEVQFHTENSFAVKNGEMHKLYERYRMLVNQDSLQEEKAILNKQMMDISANQVVPAGVKMIRRA